MWLVGACLLMLHAMAGSFASAAQPGETSRQGGKDNQPKLGFLGLHGGVFDRLNEYSSSLGLQTKYIADSEVAAESADFSDCDIIFLQHTPREYRDQLQRMLLQAKAANPRLRIISISGLAEDDLPGLVKSGLIEHDPKVEAYYGNSPENLRRLLIYVGVVYLKRPGQVLPPLQEEVSGLFHPDHAGLFPSVADFLEWAEARGKDIKAAPRVCITVHAAHLLFQQPSVVEALVREFDEQGALAVAVIDSTEQYELQLRQFNPRVVVHTCHSRDRQAFREELAVPHVHSIFFRQQSIQQWQRSMKGLSSSELAFHVASQELLGAIEPLVTAGTTQGGGSDEAFSPIPERVQHLVARAMGWVRLGTLSNLQKRIAVIYYDREMGQAELMRGSATGMFMNGPRSLIRVLQAMQRHGYRIDPVPASETQLLAWMKDHGRQIGIWAPDVLDRLARSGKAVLVPAARYRQWFEQRVPEDLRNDLIRRWGPPPGKFLVWSDGMKQFIVIPRIDLGNIILLPQPLRGEAHDSSLVHDLRVPPPHNYLATYFWLQEEFHADAMIHFGTHGSEFLLPGKPAGLSSYDWPDIVMGAVPNINPWVLNNLGESAPARRRAYAVLIDHLVPPSVQAELSDELRNVHDDIDKWASLPDGPLRERFRRSITRQAQDAGLLIDCHLELQDGELLTPRQIEQLQAYLHDIHNETTPVSLHVLGEPPPDELLLPYLVVCGGSALLDELERAVRVPALTAMVPGDREKYLRQVAAELLKRHLHQGFPLKDCLEAAGAQLVHGQVPEKLEQIITKLAQIREGLLQAHQEIDQLLAALDGRFVPPGPGGSPDRNPASVPTGRNMYLLNPEAVPARASWELGRLLMEQLLSERFQKTGGYPEKIAFTLSSFATFEDYGVLESQILFALGCRPKWDEKNLVADVELIPLEELRRPRIDVFIASGAYYRDMLPTRMRLIDRAIQLACQVDEPLEMNFVRKHSMEVERQLVQSGVAPQIAAIQSRGRIFGYAEGQIGSPGYYYLLEKSGDWDTREQLMEVYLGQVSHIYTQQFWGTPAREVYQHHLAGTEIVIRSWSDRTRSPLSNKYDWYHGGSLALAVEHLTGRRPELLLSDVRDPGNARLVNAEEALSKDFRVRLFNRKWIEGMMQQGYAGADQIAVHVKNALGWSIMRPGSVADHDWQQVVDTFIRDKKNLHIREWFEAHNPFAYQDLTAVLLETIRKGYWQPDGNTIREVAEEYARSVVRHGENGGLFGGGNAKLHAFVRQVLAGSNDLRLKDVLSDLERQFSRPKSAIAPALDPVEARPTGVEIGPPAEAVQALPSSPDPQSSVAPSVAGKVLEPIPPPSDQEASAPGIPLHRRHLLWGLIALAAALLLVAAGYYTRWGAPA
ncbi:MAG: protoporphyrin IX magnesium chelatase [Pirellulaceae bacterium]|nr:MAG: protoporphyrin IX magnesium chelatase [Pirellulaceae bacterium]